MAWLRLSGDPRHGYDYPVTPGMAACSPLHGPYRRVVKYGGDGGGGGVPPTSCWEYDPMMNGGP